MTWKIIAAVTLILGLVSGAGVPLPAGTGKAFGTGFPSRLVITGSSTVAPVVRAMAQRFQKFHPEVEVEVRGGGSGRGLTDVLDGSSDIGMVTRLLQEKEANLLGFPIARDGICLIIHRDNPVRNLSDQQVRQIYTGQITDWRAVGGRDAPIITISREEGRLALEYFANYYRLERSQIKAQLTAGDNPEVFAALAANPNAIAFISLGAAERRAREGAPIKLLPTDGVAATSHTVRTNEFPISRSLNLITRGFPEGIKLAFIKFALSPQVVDLVKDHDFVPYLD